MVVLAEDSRHQRFVRRFLGELGYRRDHIRTLPLANGRGSGEQRVRETDAAEVAALRRRNARAATALVVVIDADMLTVARRSDSFAEALVEQNLSARRDDESIAHLIPKRNIETWILCLGGDAVNEESDYKTRDLTGLVIRDAADEFFRRSRSSAEPSIPSLDVALVEARRIPVR